MLFRYSRPALRQHLRRPAAYGGGCNESLYPVSRFRGFIGTLSSSGRGRSGPTLSTARAFWRPAAGLGIQACRRYTIDTQTMSSTASGQTTNRSQTATSRFEICGHRSPFRALLTTALGRRPKAVLASPRTPQQRNPNPFTARFLPLCALGKRALRTL